MTKRYSILRKKLKELESQLDNIYSLPPDTPILIQQLLSNDFHQRFVFLKSLLSAEMASHPIDPPHHLNHIANRLNHIDSTFRQSDITSLPSSTFHHHVDDSASTCSCTESCLDDDDDDPERVSEGLQEEDSTGTALVEYYNCLFEEEKGEKERVMADRKVVPIMEFSNCLFEKEEEEEEKGKRERVMVEIDGEVGKNDKAGRVGRLCAVVVLQMVLLMGLCMVMFNGGFHFQYGGDDETFLFPT